jgi:hypothetical protein
LDKPEREHENQPQGRGWTRNHGIFAGSSPA